MVRGPCIDKTTGVKKGAWSEEEDDKLRSYVQRYGHWNWRQLPKFAGLNRCGKSCRLRWMNYLKPGVRRGNYTPQEEGLIRQLHAQFGNKWSVIAAKLPGRTDNDIKNHWHSHLMGMKPPKADHSKSEENEFQLSTLDEELPGTSDRGVEDHLVGMKGKADIDAEQTEFQLNEDESSCSTLDEASSESTFRSLKLRIYL